MINLICNKNNFKKSGLKKTLNFNKKALNRNKRVKKDMNKQMTSMCYKAAEQFQSLLVIITFNHKKTNLETIFRLRIQKEQYKSCKFNWKREKFSIKFLIWIDTSWKSKLKDLKDKLFKLMQQLSNWQMKQFSWSESWNNAMTKTYNLITRKELMLLTEKFKDCIRIVSTTKNWSVKWVWNLCKNLPSKISMVLTLLRDLIRPNKKCDDYDDVWLLF